MAVIEAVVLVRVWFAVGYVHPNLKLKSHRFFDALVKYFSLKCVSADFKSIVLHILAFRFKGILSFMIYYEGMLFQMLLLLCFVLLNTKGDFLNNLHIPFIYIMTVHSKHSVY